MDTAPSKPSSVNGNMPQPFQSDVDDHVAAADLEEGNVGECGSDSQGSFKVVLIESDPEWALSGGDSPHRSTASGWVHGQVVDEEWTVVERGAGVSDPEDGTTIESSMERCFTCRRVGLNANLSLVDMPGHEEPRSLCADCHVKQSFRAKVESGSRKALHAGQALWQSGSALVSHLVGDVSQNDTAQAVVDYVKALVDDTSR